MHIPHDKPIIYFAVGSLGTPEIVANNLESFEGKPYRVIATVKFQLVEMTMDRREVSPVFLELGNHFILRS